MGLEDTGGGDIIDASAKTFAENSSMGFRLYNDGQAVPSIFLPEGIYGLDVEPMSFSINTDVENTLKGHIGTMDWSLSPFNFTSPYETEGWLLQGVAP